MTPTVMVAVITAAIAVYIVGAGVTWTLLEPKGGHIPTDGEEIAQVVGMVFWPLALLLIFGMRLPSLLERRGIQAIPEARLHEDKEKENG